ncbi:hypothetical protein [Metasolibacillus meyeri]|uniref:hypothetical protein n=1 Tax=Metasolibacillus meyeri TaxID=1071052 RepID=UPI000D2F577C|nr:hypothetical protein [Metasolibacillus meyeri]
MRQTIEKVDKHISFSVVIRIFLEIYLQVDMLMNLYFDSAHVFLRESEATAAILSARKRSDSSNIFPIARI